MSEDRHRILEMVKQGKISVAEAEELLDAAGTAPEEKASKPKARPKYLRVTVNDKSDKVDVRIPLQIIRSGIKLGAFIPKDARDKVNQSLSEKGIDFDIANLDPKSLEELIDSFADLSVNVDEADGATVRVYCE